MATTATTTTTTTMPKMTTSQLLRERQQQQQQQQQPPKQKIQQPKKVAPNALRTIRRTFSNHSRSKSFDPTGTTTTTIAAADVELLHYGSVTLIHKKLDSWIDAKPQKHVYGIDQDVITVEDTDTDHLHRRLEYMTKKKRGRLARSWSGSVHLVPHGQHQYGHHSRSSSDGDAFSSLIESHPRKVITTTTDYDYDYDCGDTEKASSSKDPTPTPLVTGRRPGFSQKRGVLRVRSLGRNATLKQPTPAAVVQPTPVASTSA